MMTQTGELIFPRRPRLEHWSKAVKIAENTYVSTPGWEPKGPPEPAAAAGRNGVINRRKHHA